MANQQLKYNNLPVREWLRKHYIESEDLYFVSIICRHCLSVITSRSKCNGKYYKLYYHLCNMHTEVLTEEQKRDTNVHWAWDYFIPKPHKEAECHICTTILNSKYISTLTKHLDTHRREYIIFNPKSDIDMGAANSSASGDITVKDAKHQEASISTAFNLIDNMDRSDVPNESILGMSTFREPCSSLYQDEEQPDSAANDTV